MKTFLFGAGPTALPRFQVDALAELFGRFNRADVGGRIGVADSIAFTVPSRLREHTAQLGLPRMGRLAFGLALPAHGSFFTTGTPVPSTCVYKTGIGSPTMIGKSNCMARWISACCRAAISSPIASAVRSTALVVTSRSASSFNCWRP